MKSLFFRLAFLYPRLYAFFAYHRKKAQRLEFEEKVRLFFDETDPRRVKRIVHGIFEVRGGRKMQRYVIPRIDKKCVERFVTIEGLPHLDQALKEERGVLLMAGHIGNPHIGFNVLRVLGYGVTIVKGGRPRKHRWSWLRYADPDEYTIFTHDTSLSRSSRDRILEKLQSGGIMYYSADATIGKRKIEIPFLGHVMRFPTGTLHLASEAKAIVLPFMHLFRRGKIRLVFSERLDRGWIDGEAGVDRILNDYILFLESYVRQYPEEYMGMYGQTVLNECYFSLKRQGVGRAGEA